MSRQRTFFWLAAAVALGGATGTRAADDAGDMPVRAAEALRRGVAFFCGQVAVEGTYLWQYSADLAKREGEGKASAAQGWVQPPGTPSVGMAYLEAYEALGEPRYLGAARTCAYGLIRGQLRSGGWTYAIDFSAQGRKKFAYRDGGAENGRNWSTLDDNTTQAALVFLMRADRALGFNDACIHEAVRSALDAVLRAQFPNGAWPQGFEAPPDPAAFPVRKASFPAAWPREYPGHQQYWTRYTLNDQVLKDTVEMLYEAAAVYGAPGPDPEARRWADRARAAAMRAGDFLILAQLPEPQPAWAQQYDVAMYPAWARKFEPPAVTGGESQGVLRTLLRIYRETGEARYLEPVPRAIAYLQRSRLPDGRLARFYEMGTNRPLYFTREYRLTYVDNDLPTHYAFKVGDATEGIAADYERVRAQPPASLEPAAAPKPPRVIRGMEDAVRAIVDAQDARGAWVEDGRLRYHGDDDGTRAVIRCETFARNVRSLSAYLAAAGKDSSAPRH